MVDRSYLPFQSARYYRDAGMQKWSGFFLSEHTTSLEESYQAIAFNQHHSLAEKYLLLSQAYAQQLTLTVLVKEDKMKRQYQGRIVDLNKATFILYTDQGHQRIKMADTLQLTWMEEETDDEERIL